MINILVAMTTLLAGTRERITGRITQGGDEAGFTTLEWAVIGSIAFAMAVAIGTGLTAVANSYLGKIG